MRVSDILKVKGNTLFTVTPDTTLHDAVNAMAEHDIGSLVVMEYGDLVGMLTFREIILTLSENGGSVGTSTIRKVMDDPPLTCTPETDVNEVRRMMLEHHVRYLPVMESRTLMGVISFYDVAKAVVEEQGFENRMLKAYIRDWPEEPEGQGQQTGGWAEAGSCARAMVRGVNPLERRARERALFLCPAFSVSCSTAWRASRTGLPIH